MKRLQAALLAALAVSLLSTQAEAQRPDAAIPDPNEGYQWKEVAKKHKLPPEDVAQLARDKVLVTNNVYKQIFTPYIETDLPPFITSDSLLNAFHVLFEESVLRLERANARKLPDILRGVWNALENAGKEFKGRPELVAVAKTRARVVIGTALRLVGDESIDPDTKIAALIEAEVARVTAATARVKPEWLGPPDGGFLRLDYSRYRPRGFYTKSEELQRYFRAVAWLQSIPFRVNKDEELVAAVMLGGAFCQGDLPRRKQIDAFFEVFDRLLGRADDWEIRRAARDGWFRPDRDLDPEVLHKRLREKSPPLKHDLDGGALDSLRKWLLEKADRLGDRPMIGDQRSLPPGDLAVVAALSFRVFPARRTPDAVLFQRTTDWRTIGGHPFPTGLEVATLLGSSYARQRLPSPDRDKVLAAIEQSRSLLRDGALYGRYLLCLAALVDEPEPEAPAFVSDTPWQAKSCQTVLAGWAQLRHTWSLHAKQTVLWESAFILPAGFVEPEPEFFARMGRLTEAAEDLLRRAGALEPDPRTTADEIRRFLAMLRRKGFPEKTLDIRKDASPEERALFRRLWPIATWLSGKRWYADDHGQDPRKAVAEGIRRLERLADEIEQGRQPKEPELARAVERITFDLRPLWRKLQRLCWRLEALAHKQLRGAPLSKDDNFFLRCYGFELARIMLYRETSYAEPDDDAPRVIDVFYNPNEEKYLEVGVARPRALYVLYPYKGGEVLCRGAVLPYYEFRCERRLTDAQWKAMLDSKGRPEIPAWIKPIVATGGIGTPEMK